MHDEYRHAQRFQIVRMRFNIRHLVDTCLNWHRTIDHR